MNLVEAICQQGQKFARFIVQPEFPCIGAKAALAQGGLGMLFAHDITSSRDDLAIHGALGIEATKFVEHDPILRSFVVIFDVDNNLDEGAFETALWQRLSGLAAIDAALNTPWANNASDDVTAPDYAMSVGGVAYFVIGLHPRASRVARQFSQCALVFNAHRQFDVMRDDGRYKRFQATNRAREKATNGSTNPMLREFGQWSEAAQYSGRLVDDTWVCPFSKDQIVA
jgi:uncharacterized protein